MSTPLEINTADLQQILIQIENLPPRTIPIKKYLVASQVRIGYTGQDIDCSEYDYYKNIDINNFVFDLKKFIITSGGSMVSTTCINQSSYNPNTGILTVKRTETSSDTAVDVVCDIYIIGD